MTVTEIPGVQKKNKVISVISFTRNGFALSVRISGALEALGNVRTTLYTKKEEVARTSAQAVWVKDSLQSWCASVFHTSSALIFIGASGIAVRTIAPFLVSKKTDPAVLVADEEGKHVISLLSGHLGGGNELTVFLAKALCADPVITTASDVGGKLAVDVWAAKNHLTICDMGLAKLAAAEIVDGKQIPFCCDGGIRGNIPGELKKLADFNGMTRSEQSEMNNPACGILVSVRRPDTEIRENRNQGKNRQELKILHLVPRRVILGIGCRKGKSCQELWQELERILKEYSVAPESLCRMASIDLKKAEPGLLQLAEELGIPFETFSREQLKSVPGEYAASAFVSQITGVDNVCERAAVAALRKEEQKNARFICRKQAENGVTIALLEAGWEVCFE